MSKQITFYIMYDIHGVGGSKSQYSFWILNFSWKL